MKIDELEEDAFLRQWISQVRLFNKYNDTQLYTIMKAMLRSDLEWEEMLINRTRHKSLKQPANYEHTNESNNSKNKERTEETNTK